MAAARDDAEMERRAQEMAEKALAGLGEAARAAKLKSVRQSILHRLRFQEEAGAAAGAAAEEAAPPPSGAAGGAARPAEGAAPPAAEAAPAVAPAVAAPSDPLGGRAPEDGVELFGDERWYLDAGLLLAQRAQVAAAHAEQKILVGPPADEIRRICPGGGRVLGAGAVLRLGGSHHGGYGEADIAYTYRQLSRALHPDKNPTVPEAPDAFRRLREAADELKALLAESRTALRVLCGTRRGAEATPEMLERPQGALLAEAARVLGAVLGLGGEGALPEGATALAAASCDRFDGSGRDLLSRWYDSEAELLSVFAGTPIRAAYDCAPKRYRAQLVCALSRAAQAEAARFDGCVRGAWQVVLGQFPEVGLWRGFLDRLNSRVWSPEEPAVAQGPRRGSMWDDSSGPRTSSWGRLWRSVISEVLPAGPEEPAPPADGDVRLLAAALWAETVAWAQQDQEAARALQLFRAEPGLGAAGAEWAFLPAAELLLAVGSGIVGLTAAGFVGGSGLRRRFGGALRRARAAAEAEKAAAEAEAQAPASKRRRTSETATRFLLVVPAGGGAREVSRQLEGDIVAEAGRFGTVLRCVEEVDGSRRACGLALELERRSDAKNVGERLKAKRFGEESVDFSFLREPAFQELKAARAEAVGAPTKVLLLRNVADAGEVDVDFECKLLEEARRFGRVRRCVVRECSAGADAGAVRAFLDFRLASDAATALADLQGRVRDGRRAIRASFYEEARLREGDLDA